MIRRQPSWTPIVWCLSITLVAGCADEAAVAPVPPEQLAARVGETCVVEITVAAVKHSERRCMHFLNATPNFRSNVNVGVAIDEASMERFRQAGVNDLRAAYLNRTLRVRGKITRDEGQPLVVVTSPDQIAIVKTPQDSQEQSAALTIENERGEAKSLQLPLEGYTRESVDVEHHGVHEVYEGVPLSLVLERAGIELGAEARGAMVSRYVRVCAADGYGAVLAIAEVDPFLSSQVVLLADRVNGEPLARGDGPLRLIVPADKRHRRWVRQVATIEVRQVSDERPSQEKGP